MLGAVQSQLGVLQLGQIFVLGDVPEIPDLDLCCTTVESLIPDRTLACFTLARTLESLIPHRTLACVVSDRSAESVTGPRTVELLCECP